MEARGGILTWPNFPTLWILLLRSLALRLATGAALRAPGGGAVQVLRGDPALVVALVGTAGGALAAGEGFLLGDGLGLLDSLLGLGEEGLDVGLVDEVASTTEGGGQEGVQEDATERTHC